MSTIHAEKPFIPPNVPTPVPAGGATPAPAGSATAAPAGSATPPPTGNAPPPQRSAADPAEPESPLARLTPEQLEQLGREFDAIHDEVRADLGDRDSRYIRSTIKLHRQLVLAARAMLLGSRYKPLWFAGTASLSIAKILENMEIGHNVMHGQWDWMNDPDINSQSWDWDTASPADAWRHSHNYEHHTFTNIRGKDRDLGYEIMRIDPHQKWHPVYLLQPFYNLLLMGFFEWGVAFHDLNFDAIKAGEKSKEQLLEELKAIGVKARRQAVKDYIAFPLLSAAIAGAVEAARTRVTTHRGAGAAAGGAYKSTLTADFTANIVRNVWAYSIIFCGHFPDQTYTFNQAEVAEETRGGWYVRQLLGSANIEGGPLFHFLAGNLSFQVEHHLYPDMPSSRYAEIAPRVRDVCHRYGLPYNTGPFSKQLGNVQRTILRLAFPGGKPRRKPGPYRPS
ncbi:MAG TPA: fatty acid desaturase [Solirubrobacteraceae bacterium]|jgi:linoleoyl-CoA desaturase|nr:fatty acid desaturase [Solirubrobacteraceae bacterium]